MAIKRMVLPVLGSLLAAFILGEVMLRLIGYSAAVWYQPDPQLGWTLRPGVSGWFTREGRAYVEVSASGLRDREHTVEKPAGVYRIAVLGDSYSEAMQVAREQAYWALLPERLNACGFRPGTRVEVLNFGVSGYGTAQEYLMLEAKALKYRPDFVLLQFTNGNDVKNNSADMEEERSRPFFRLVNGKLQLDDSFVSSSAYESRNSLRAVVGRKLADHVRLVQLARVVKETGLVSAAHASAVVEEGLDRAPLAPPPNARWEKAWALTEELILKTREAAARNGAGFLLITVPYAIQVHPDGELRASLQRKLGVPDLFYPDRRLAALGEKERMAVLPLAPEMQRLAELSGRHFHGFENIGMGRGHWNPEGHRVAADLIATRLCEGI